MKMPARKTGRTADAIGRCIASAKMGNKVAYLCTNRDMQSYCFRLAHAIDNSGIANPDKMKIRFGKGAVYFKTLIGNPAPMRGEKWVSLIDHSARIERDQFYNEWRHFIETTAAE